MRQPRTTAARGAGEDDAAATAADGEEYSVVEIPMSVFLGFASVRKFLASQGLDRDAPDWKLHQYVPRNVVVQLWTSRVRGTVGDAALDGHVAFDLAYYNYNTTAAGATHYSASYLVVMTLYGEVVQVRETAATVARSIRYAHASISLSLRR